MTVAEYAAGVARCGGSATGSIANPLLMMFVGPSLVFLFERRFPQRGMTSRGSCSASW